jgi:hypothetical protein
MNWRAHFIRHRVFYAVLLVALLARLVFFFDAREVWWDSGVYVGMGKYALSGGSSGLWEHIRPVLWPLILGIGWVMKLNVLWFARVLELLVGLVCAGLVYVLGRKWFSEKAGIIASVLWGFSPIVFYLGFHEYTELPATAFVLGSLVAFSYQRWLVAGLLAGLAFLAKFPAGLFIAVLVISAFFVEKKARALASLTAGFLVPAGIFLGASWFLYGNALQALIDAGKSITSVLGCNVLRYNPWWYYAWWVVFDNMLNVFAILGVGIALRKPKKFLLPLLALVIPVVYFMQLHCREYRYMVLFFGILVLFSGYGISVVVEWLEKRTRKNLWQFVLILVVVVSVLRTHTFYYDNEPRILDENAEQYYRWLGQRTAEGEIWSSNPVVSVYADLPVNKIYYPVYEAGNALDFNSYLEKNTGRIGVVFLDNCGGGIICPPNDVVCGVELEKMRFFLKQNFRQSFSAESGSCWYEIYER